MIDCAPHGQATCFPRSPLLRFEACALTHHGKIRPRHEDAFVLGSLTQSAQITAAVILEDRVHDNLTILALRMVK